MTEWSDFAPLYSILTGESVTPDEFTSRYVDETGSKPSWLGRLFGKKPTPPGAKYVDQLARALAGKIDACVAIQVETGSLGEPKPYPDPTTAPPPPSPAPACPSRGGTTGRRTWGPWATRTRR